MLARRPCVPLVVRGHGGYSLIELVVTLGVMVLVIGALAVLFSSGIRSEAEQAKRLEAQQNARTALVRMREELHCANGVTAAPSVAVSSVTATIPAGCLGLTGADVAVTFATTPAAAGTWRLNRVESGVTTQLAEHLTTATPFTYVPASAASRARLDLVFPIDVDLTDAAGSWRLEDFIVLRNTVRQ